MRGAITAFFRMALRIFFRRIEIVGLDRVPDASAVIFACNHPNGLVDPLFILCYAGRPVSFLGKAPLFRYPVIGWFVRLFESIPVYRKQDNTTGSNHETFERARAVLRRGGAIAIFPEGTTHDDPQLRELKTGAARIALGAGVDGMLVVPSGIYYTAKHVFRSSALLMLGEPLRVESVVQDDPPPEEVDLLTAAIDAGIDTVTVQADSHAALDLIARAEDIFTGNDEQPLAEELELRRRFIGGYHYLRSHDPQRLERLESALAQFESALRRAKIDVHELRPRISVARLFRVLVLLPIAIAGAVVSYPAYLLIGMLVKRFAKGEGAVMATIKFLGALALYPLSYILVAVLVGMRFGWIFGVTTGLLLPPVAYAALIVFEDIDDIIGDVRAIAYRLFRRYGYERLVAQRKAIRDEIITVARELGY
ncbi:MAG TPA: lysophospholipid acyltransferase family protein [Thermoanaerobaculia bacterium]|nr:lysophospholipid acyltransferase family protein [Thermoanaerobaculia bacterium]